MEYHINRDFVSIDQILSKGKKPKQNLLGKNFYIVNKVNDLIEREKDLELSKKLFEYNFNINDAFNNIMNSDLTEDSDYNSPKNNTKKNASKKTKNKYLKEAKMQFSPSNSDIMSLGVMGKLKAPIVEKVSLKIDEDNIKMQKDKRLFKECSIQEQPGNANNYTRKPTIITNQGFTKNNFYQNINANANTNNNKIYSINGDFNNNEAKQPLIKHISHKLNSSEKEKYYKNLNLESHNYSTRPLSLGLRAKETYNYNNFRSLNDLNNNLNKFSKLCSLNNDSSKKGFITSNKFSHNSTQKLENYKESIKKDLEKNYNSSLGSIERESPFKLNGSINLLKTKKEAEGATIHEHISQKINLNCEKEKSNMKKFLSSNANFISHSNKANKVINFIPVLFSSDTSLNNLPFRTVNSSLKESEDSEARKLIACKKSQSSNYPSIDKHDSLQEKKCSSNKNNNQGSIVIKDNFFSDKATSDKFYRTTNFSSNIFQQSYNNSSNENIYNKISSSSAIYKGIDSNNNLKAKLHKYKTMNCNNNIDLDINNNNNNRDNNNNDISFASKNINRSLSNQLSLKNDLDYSPKEYYSLIVEEMPLSKDLHKERKNNVKGLKATIAEATNSQGILKMSKTSDNFFNIEKDKNNLLPPQLKEQNKNNPVKNFDINTCSGYYSMNIENKKNLELKRQTLFTPESKSSLSPEILMKSINRIQNKTKKITKSLSKNMNNYKLKQEAKQKEEIDERVLLKLKKKPRTANNRVVLISSSVEEKRKNFSNLSENRKSLLEIAEFIESMNDKIVFELKDDVEKRYKLSAMKNGLVNVRELYHNKYSKLFKNSSVLDDMTLKTKQLENKMLKIRSHIEEKYFITKVKEIPKLDKFAYKAKKK